MRGAELAARYAFPPNAKGYCGASSFVSALRNHLAGKAAPLEQELKKFKAHYAYLSLIARENRVEPFDLDVVKAFWLGNPLLRSVSRESLSDFIVSELFSGKQKSRAERLAARLPRGVVPHHSFNSLYINFVSGKVKKTVENYDSCCVSAGRVLSASGKKADVVRDSIAWDGRFFLTKKTEKISLERCGIRFLDAVRPGDVLSIHWGMAIQRLKPSDATALNKYTRMNIDAINRSLER